MNFCLYFTNSRVQKIISSAFPLAIFPFVNYVQINCQQKISSLFLNKTSSLFQVPFSFPRGTVCAESSKQTGGRDPRSNTIRARLRPTYKIGIIRPCRRI